MDNSLLRFSLRIPTQLHSDLKVLADKDMRSLNMYILKVLENHVESNKVTRDANIRATSQRNVTKEDVFYVNINLDDK